MIVLIVFSFLRMVRRLFPEAMIIRYVFGILKLVCPLEIHSRDMMIM